MVKNLCIVQARLTSSRLQSKILQTLGDSNITLLEHVYNRLNNVSNIDKIVFAIPDTETNDKLAYFLKEKQIEFFRGSEENVLSRFYNCVKFYKSSIIIRATCDNPFVDGRLVSFLINNIGNYDYVGCKDTPIGTSVEVFTFEALEKAFIEAKDMISKEHVTPYIYKNPNMFSIKMLPYKSDTFINSFRLTIDTKEDLELANIIYKELYKGYPINNNDVYNFLQQNPLMAKINAKIKQNKV